MTENLQQENRPPEPDQGLALLTADELARLRELACTPKKSWWADYGLLIAMAGFGLSLATGMISAYVGYRKDIHDQQAQLASTLQNIQDLTFKQAEVYEKYKGTSYEAIATMITGEVNSEYRTATELALSLGSNATTAELATIAGAQYGIGDPKKVRRLLENALDNAQNANDKSIALRYLGFFEIHNGVTAGERAEGEKLFARAMKLDQEYDYLKSFPYTIHFLRATGALDWANAIAPFDCSAAQTHFGEGVTDLEANPRTPEMDQMRRTALLAYSTGLGGVPACRPSGQTVLSQ
jgi:hypothetical protein